MAEYTHSKNVFKTVLARSEAEKNGYLCFEKMTVIWTSLIWTDVAYMDVTYIAEFWNFCVLYRYFWNFQKFRLFLTFLTNCKIFDYFVSFVKAFAKVESKNKTTYFWTIFDRRNSVKVNFCKRRNNENFRPTQCLIRK